MRALIAGVVLGAGLLAGCAPIRPQPWDSTPKKAAKITANVAIWTVVAPVLVAGGALYVVGAASNANAARAQAAPAAAPMPQTCTMICSPMVGGRYVTCDQVCQ